jgi:hypothetical protein
MSLVSTKPRPSLGPWILLGVAVILGLLETSARVDAVRRGYRLEALRRTRNGLREDERVLRIDLAGEQRAAEARARAAGPALGGTGNENTTPAMNGSRSE